MSSFVVCISCLVLLKTWGSFRTDCKVLIPRWMCQSYITKLLSLIILLLLIHTAINRSTAINESTAGADASMEVPISYIT